MGAPCLLVDNYFSSRIYSGHTLSALENSSDAPLVGAARRSTYDAYQSATPNADAWVKSRNAVTRYADMVVVERGHNQGGKTVKVQCSDDDFATPAQEPFTGITPTAAGTGSLDDALGVRTWEGAWLKRFSPRAAYDWRYFVPAMGAGLKPLVPGLWIGLSWRPGYADRPFAPGVTELIVEEMHSDRGWLGRGKATPRRTGVLHFSFGTMLDAEAADWHVQQIARGRAFWIIPDDERADLAFLAVLPKGNVGMVLEPRWFYPKLDLPYVELDPLVP